MKYRISDRIDDEVLRRVRFQVEHKVSVHIWQKFLEVSNPVYCQVWHQQSSLLSGLKSGLFSIKKED
jgi:hypothetical protein